MTAVPLEPTVAVGLGSLVIGWLLLWAREDGAAGRNIAPLSPQRSWHCQICAAFYTTTAAERLTICPRCGSYNSEEGPPT